MDPVTASRFDALVATQHGVVTRPQLLDLGIPARTISNWVHSGRLVVVGPGTYRVAGAPLGPHHELMAACLATDGHASHRSAAVLLGVPAIRADCPEVTVARGRGPRPSPWRVHECDDLTRAVGRPVDGIPCTTVPQVAVDLAGLVTAHEISRSTFDDAVEWLVRRRCTSWPELQRAVAAASDRRAYGIGHLRTIVEEYCDDGAESRLERRFLRLVRHAGLPAPVTQLDVHDEEGFVMRVDVGWPRRRVAVELDSVRFHLRADAFEADRAKRNRLRVAGWLLLEYTSRRLRSAPEAVLSEVAAALAR